MNHEVLKKDLAVLAIKVQLCTSETDYHSKPLFSVSQQISGSLAQKRRCISERIYLRLRLSAPQSFVASLVLYQAHNKMSGIWEYQRLDTWIHLSVLDLKSLVGGGVSSLIVWRFLAFGAVYTVLNIRVSLAIKWVGSLILCQFLFFSLGLICVFFF